MTDLTLYGPHWSAYTRTARLTLIEKNVEYQLEEVDFSSGVMPEAHRLRHPFSKVPVLRHDQYLIYETSAICRYIDAAFKGPELQPSTARSLGRMAQIIAILDSNASDAIRMGFVTELLINPMSGVKTDHQRVETAQLEITRAFSALCGCMESGDYLVGDQLTLADLHAAPLFDYLSLTPGGNQLIQTNPQLHAWWSNMLAKPSLIATRPDLSVFGRLVGVGPQQQIDIIENTTK